MSNEMSGVEVRLAKQPWSEVFGQLDFEQEGDVRISEFALEVWDREDGSWGAKVALYQADVHDVVVPAAQTLVKVSAPTREEALDEVQGAYWAALREVFRLN